MQTQIRVYTLGRFAIERDGQVLENFLSTKTEVLFAYLALHPGEHPREKLASLFWSETNDEQSLKNLRTVLSSLRRQLNDVLDVSRQTLSVREDTAIWVDAQAFEAACTNGFSGGANPLQAMRELAALYQGPFLATVRVRDADDLNEWISHNQYRLAQLHRELLAGIVAQALEQARYPLGLQYAHELIGLDPLWEEPRRQLMRLLALSGRTGEALTQYEQFAQLLKQELDVVPDDETTALYEQLKAGTISAGARTAQATIAAPDSLFVEPVEDIEFANRMLNSPQCRLLTIYGISGIGKTALASQITFQRQQHYRDGARIVALSQAQSPSQLPLLVARALGLEVAASAVQSDVMDTVTDYLKPRQMLLVLDNYEQILPDTAFIEQLLEAGSQLQLVVTSQNPLNLYQEWLLPLRGLLVPDAGTADAAGYEAVRLFELTAQRLNPRFNVAEVLDTVVRICRLVDGLPLGVILAAGWTQVLPVSRIVEHIADGMAFNIAYQRSWPARHQSIEVMLEHTWNTLDASQQHILTVLSVFEGAFDLDAFMHLCEGRMDILFTLIQKSLILKFDESYRMHQLVGRYARRKLVFSPARETLAQRYLDYYRAYMEGLQQRALPVHEYLIAIETEYPNLWNFTWMPTSFQPVYALSMSRYLIVYWEISHNVNVPDILSLLEQFRSEPTLAGSAEWTGLLNLQLARLYQHQNQQARSLDALSKALACYCCLDSWTDHAILYNLYAWALNGAGAASDGTSTEDDILLSVYYNLALLNLDVRDFQASGQLFEQLGGTMPAHPGRAALRAGQAALEAAEGRYGEAYAQFQDALRLFNTRTEAELALLIEGSLLRLAAAMHLGEKLETLLATTLSRAVALAAEPALANLLAFCEALKQDAALSADMTRAFARLPDSARAHPQVTAFLGV